MQNELKALLDELETSNTLHHLWNATSDTQAGQARYFALKRAIDAATNVMDDTLRWQSNDALMLISKGYVRRIFTVPSPNKPQLVLSRYANTNSWSIAEADNGASGESKVIEMNDTDWFEREFMGRTGKYRHLRWQDPRTVEPPYMMTQSSYEAQTGELERAYAGLVELLMNRFQLRMPVIPYPISITAFNGRPDTHVKIVQRGIEYDHDFTGAFYALNIDEFGNEYKYRLNYAHEGKTSHKVWDAVDFMQHQGVFTSWYPHKQN